MGEPVVPGYAAEAMGTDADAIGTAIDAIGTPVPYPPVSGTSSSTVTTSSTTVGCGAGAGFLVDFFLPPRKGRTPSGPAQHRERQQHNPQQRRNQKNQGRPHGISVVVVTVNPERNT